MGRHANRAPDDGHVEREDDHERHGGVGGELDVVERNIHEPVLRQRHALWRTYLVLDKVDRQLPLLPASESPIPLWVFDFCEQ